MSYRLAKITHIIPNGVFLLLNTLGISYNNERVRAVATHKPMLRNRWRTIVTHLPIKGSKKLVKSDIVTYHLLRTIQFPTVASLSISVIIEQASTNAHARELQAPSPFAQLPRARLCLHQSGHGEYQQYLSHQCLRITGEQVPKNGRRVHL